MDKAKTHRHAHDRSPESVEPWHARSSAFALSAFQSATEGLSQAEAGAAPRALWATGRGLPVEEARTIVVNTMVVLEIFYLFSVRHLHTASINVRGVMGTKPVLIGVGAVTLAQFAFTYFRPMQTMFDTRALSVLDGAIIIANGLALLFILEMEKRIRRLVKLPHETG